MSKHFNICYLLWFASPFFQSHSEVAQNGIRASYSFPQGHLALREPVVVTFSITNETPQSIQLDLGQDRKGGYLLTLTEPNGRRLALSQFSREGISVPGTLTVQPGQSFSQRLVINEWYDFEKSGKYLLEIRLRQPILIQGNSTPMLEAGSKGDISIGPKDATSLQNLCEHLNNQIGDSDSYETAAEAALELSYVADPIAVPYMERALLSGKMVEPIVIAGLERIADESAIRVLISNLRCVRSGTPILARAALQRIQRQISNANLKEEILRALKDPGTPES